MKIHVEFDIEFRRNPYEGLYLAFEGIDGSGKSTQLERAREYFEEKGKEVVVTWEPRNDLLIGNLLRSVINGDVKIPSVALQYLYSADRIINHEEIVHPALKAGKVVLTHRSLWSTLPYGMFDKGVDYSEHDADLLLVAQSMLSMYHQTITPDKTFYFDVPAEIAAQRISARKSSAKNDIYEKKEKLAKILRGYHWMIKRFPEEFIVFDGQKKPEELTKEMLPMLNDL